MAHVEQLGAESMLWRAPEPPGPPESPQPLGLFFLLQREHLGSFLCSFQGPFLSLLPRFVCGVWGAAELCQARKNIRIQFTEINGHLFFFKECSCLRFWQNLFPRLLGGALGRVQALGASQVGLLN